MHDRALCLSYLDEKGRTRAQGGASREGHRTQRCQRESRDPARDGESVPLRERGGGPLRWLAHPLAALLLFIQLRANIILIYYGV